MKIGILATGYNCAEYFTQVLEPWIKFKEYVDLDDKLVISVVSGKFQEFDAPVLDDSRILMKEALDKKQIDYLALPVGAFQEAEIRNLALHPLLQEKCDIIWLLDFDEIYKVDQIVKTLEFVENNPFTTWFKIRFKNYVFDKQHYVKDFCPPRIFRTESLAEFYFDNDIHYYSDGGKVSYKNFSSMEVPQVFVDHYTWCGSPQYLKNKINYQLKHFNGICSYKWDQENNKLALDMDFYKKHNVPVPVIYEEE